MDQTKQDLIVKPPSPLALRSACEFIIRTIVPRILAEEKNRPSSDSP